MRFVLFVEGDTEADVLPNLLKRCVEPQLEQTVGIKTVNFHGWANLWRDVRQKADFYLRGPGASSDIIAVISLMDLYGPQIYPSHCLVAEDRLRWAKEKLEMEISHERFRHFFAVHELEAWLFSQPDIFQNEVRKDIQPLSAKPEGVNFDSPPKRRLDSIFEHRLKRGYQQRVDGAKLFRLLKPEIVQARCPVFRAMVDQMVEMAKQSPN